MDKFIPKCADNKKLAYISAEGYMKPCCWRDPVMDHFNSAEYNLKIHTMDVISANIDTWLESELKKPISQVDQCCKKHCVYNIVTEIEMSNDISGT
jgi:hypothetical protein